MTRCKRQSALVSVSLLMVFSCKTVHTNASRLKDSSGDEINITIDARSDDGQWQGWGTSLAWWASTLGDRDDLADIFFTTKTTRFDNRDLPGLGFNIARFNAGASSNVAAANGERMVASKKLDPSRKIEGFWNDWNSEDPNSSSWNWNADPKQVAMLKKAKDRGANHLELFSNSPMWWMLYNHNPSGWGGNENLQPWNYQKHAVYLATIAKHAKDSWGINFESVEPFNEPTANWWTDFNNQEGCHFDPETMTTIIGYESQELANRGLNAMVTASDENLYDEAVTTYRIFDQSTRSKLGRINVHGYQELKGRRDLLYSMAKETNKPIWNSEYGEGDPAGLRMAKNILMDFQWLHPVGWVYWQVLDGYNWGIIDAHLNDNWVGGVLPKYYVLAQFSRHIREGMKILRSKQDNAVAAYDGANHKLIVVAANDGPARWMDFDLTSFRKADGSENKAHRWTTVTDGSELYGAHFDIAVRDRKFQALFPANSVQTFEIENVEL
ncbi:MAG: beta-1,6-galactanase [Chitinophagaceae bacterium]|nr:beta-1,6-galactanase [Oligoflexus sp.]